MKQISILFFTLLLLGACVRAPTQTDNFMKIVDGRFSVNDKPYYYIGINFWYATILGSQGQGGNRERPLKELDFMKANSITDLRVLIGADGIDGIMTKAEPALQMAPGVYNDTIFDGLDSFLSELGKRGMHAILFLNNSREWFGGYSQYLYWSDHGEVSMPKVAGWDASPNYVTQYAKSEKAHKLFESHVRRVVSRVNRYTKLKCSNNPAIVARQVGNEPCPFGEENKESLAKWIAECVALIKSIDPNHLISVGSEGMAGCEGDLDLRVKLHQDINIDYSMVHTWPNNWGWIDKTDIPGTLDRTIANTHEYIDVHVAGAQKMNKPLVLEEFKPPRDSVMSDRKSSTVLRDRYYEEIFEIVKEHVI